MECALDDGRDWLALSPALSIDDARDGHGPSSSKLTKMLYSCAKMPRKPKLTTTCTRMHAWGSLVRVAICMHSDMSGTSR